MDGEEVIVIESESTPKWYKITAKTTVTITIRDGTKHTDTGIDSSEGDSYDAVYNTAVKGSVTDGIRRAARHLGQLFYCVYDADYQEFILKGEHSEIFNDILFRDKRLLTASNRRGKVSDERGLAKKGGNNSSSNKVKNDRFNPYNKGQRNLRM